ncbi:nuclear transport factor 2 family protein [Cognatishimia sp. MH4019]|uniref:nuclear transport factor 2 family protein n=1 Tax=Cognatishimia sp. MH4019 TaxID=2854030 RepID=UPI001CD2694F|nr:nuclear transport factor 2 family protein [Cognatishimia sp. MH4019]
MPASLLDLNDLRQTSYQLLSDLSEGRDVAEIYHPNARFFGVHPFNERIGIEAIADVWTQLRAALPDLERRSLTHLAGPNLPDARVSTPRAAHLVAAMGHFQGRFLADLCDIPATGKTVTLRFCEAHELVDGKIATTYLMLDLADLMLQAGVWPFVRALGAEQQWYGPATSDGLRLEGNATDTASMDVVLTMHAALLRFDGKSLESMPHADYWHPDFMWYGPAGIGTTRGLEEFRAHHQIPFLTGFPDRAGAGHYIRISDGDYAVTGGWPSVSGTHLGPWLGMPATGKRINMRVMDFYRLADGRIRENWVPIDIIDIARQMGVDAFERVRHMTGKPRLSL